MSIFKKSPPKNFPFSDSPDLGCLLCVHTSEKGILYVSHDSSDGMWQFTCGEGNHEYEDAKLVSLSEVFQQDNSIGALAKMPRGYHAERKDVNSPWKISE